MLLPGAHGHGRGGGRGGHDLAQPGSDPPPPKSKTEFHMPRTKSSEIAVDAAGVCMRCPVLT
eukprot:544853-Rhodomonas_salina.1